MRILLAAIVLVASQPSWALYKCVSAAGPTSFQELPCEGAKTSTTIKAAIEPEKLGTAPARPSLVDQSKELESERLRRGTEFALRDRRAQLASHQARCDNRVRDIAANRLGFNNNLAGATRSQAEATAASAHATNCDTQSRQIEGEIAELQRQCAAQKCDPARAFN